MSEPSNVACNTINEALPATSDLSTADVHDVPDVPDVTDAILRIRQDVPDVTDSILRIRRDVPIPRDVARDVAIPRGVAIPRTRRDRIAILRTQRAMDAILWSLEKTLQALDSSLDVPGDTVALDTANRAFGRVNSAFSHFNAIVRQASAPATYTHAELNAFLSAHTAIWAELRAVCVALNLVFASISRFLNTAV